MMFKVWKCGTVVALLAGLAVPSMAKAAQLSGDARASIPRDVQQIIVVDYRAMQNSPAAMQLKDRVLPPELKRLETSLKTSGLKVDQDADTLAFAAFRARARTARGFLALRRGSSTTQSILANFTKQKTKPVMVRREHRCIPMGVAGMSVAFLNQTTMVFGDRDAVKAALDARDGLAPNFLQNGDMMNEMAMVDSQRGVEPSGPEGHADHDEERSGRGVAAGRLRHGEEPDEERSLHHGLLQRREVRYGGRDVGHDDRGDGSDPDEGCCHAEEDLGIAAGEERGGRHDDRLQLGNPDGELLVLGQ